jgi:predicted RNA polymerase sigma factor
LTHADVLVSLGKPGESIPQWDHAIALSPPAAQRGLVIRRAHAVACSGAHEQAMNVVDRLEAERDLTANQSYDLACVCAQAAAVVGIVPAVKEAYALRAIALLRQAVQSGFRAFETLKNDRDLDSLRSRPDFKALLEALMKSMQG